jgi:prevent-host-death family protein
METVGSYQAKTHLSALLERVASGERIRITRHGVPIAMLVPLEAEPRRDFKEVTREIKDLRKGRTLGGITIRQLIEEGRRY